MLALLTILQPLGLAADIGGDFSSSIQGQHIGTMIQELAGLGVLASLVTTVVSGREGAHHAQAVTALIATAVVLATITAVKAMTGLGNL